MGLVMAAKNLKISSGFATSAPVTAAATVMVDADACCLLCQVRFSKTYPCAVSMAAGGGRFFTLRVVFRVFWTGPSRRLVSEK